MEEERDALECLQNDPEAFADSADAESLFVELYEQLHRHASDLMRKERRNHTLQPTALLHEAYLRIANSKTSFRDKNHFVATASIVLRHILVNYARAKGAKKRGENTAQLSIHDVAEQFQDACVDILALDSALQELAQLDSMQHRLVELRFFGGLTNREAAEALGISERSAYSEWAHARAWLKCQLGDDG
ncbi:MAG: ECF-type sigma factor [Planctomycetota bacterium]